jgi:8-oxo-dGTP pyrophosphatase MutT (NUDIX family)
MVDYQEQLEIALFREVEEEVGLTFEFVEPTNRVRMISPLRFD